MTTTWKEFQKACRNGANLREFHTIATAWRDYKLMHIGVIHLIGDLFNPHKECYWEYDFMSWGFAEDILEELSEKELEVPKIVNREALLDYYEYQRMNCDGDEGPKWELHMWVYHRARREFLLEEITAMNLEEIIKRPREEP